MQVVANLLTLCLAMHMVQGTSEKDGGKEETEISKNTKFYPGYFCNARCSYLCFLRGYWTGQCLVPYPNAVPTCLCSLVRSEENGSASGPGMLGNDYDFMDPRGDSGTAMFGSNHDFMDPFPNSPTRGETFHDDKLGTINLQFFPNGVPPPKNGKRWEFKP